HGWHPSASEPHAPPTAWPMISPHMPGQRSEGKCRHHIEHVFDCQAVRLLGLALAPGKSDKTPRAFTAVAWPPCVAPQMNAFSPVRARPMMSFWIWLVPSYSVVTRASRRYLPTGNSST